MDEIWKLTTEQIEFFWPQLCDLIERHPDDFPFYYTPEVVKSMLNSGEIDAWVGFKNDKAEIELAALLSFEVYPIHTSYKFLWIGGRNWRKFMPGSLSKIEEYAFLQGAQVLKADCRPGWFKLLTKQGFKANKIIMSKSLVKTRGH